MICPKCGYEEYYLHPHGYKSMPFEQPTHWHCHKCGHEEKVGGEKPCESCYWNDDDGPYAGCIISRGRTGRDLCTRLGGNVDRWIGWPEVEKP